MSHQLLFQSDEEEEEQEQAPRIKSVKSHAQPRLKTRFKPPKQHQAMEMIVRKQKRKRKRRCSPFFCCCCCGPCLGGCLKWLLLCGTLCFAVLLGTALYIRSSRSCCGESSDLCLAYASIKIPDEYEQFMSQFRGHNATSKHKLRRAFDHCVIFSSDANDCYSNLLTCMDTYMDPFRALHTL